MCEENAWLALLGCVPWRLGIYIEAVAAGSSCVHRTSLVGPVANSMQCKAQLVPSTTRLHTTPLPSEGSHGLMDMEIGGRPGPGSVVRSRGPADRWVRGGGPGRMLVEYSRFLAMPVASVAAGACGCAERGPAVGGPVL